MQGRPRAVLLLLVAVTLLSLFYPAIFLDHVVAPEASMRAFPPWRALLGPFPQASPVATDAATHLGPRLAIMARAGLTASLWEPWIGGGRAGWLASAAEGGAPLPVLAALLARPDSVWTALVALEVAASLALAWWLLRILGIAAGPAGVGALIYALSGAVTTQWLGYDGSAVCLGPLILVAVASTAGSWRGHAAAMGVSLAVLAFCGPAAAPFLALAATLLALRTVSRQPGVPGWRAVVLALAIGLAMIAPRVWLAASTSEPGVTAETLRVSRAVPSLRAFVTPFLLGDPAEASLSPSPPSLEALRSADSAYVGIVALMLAALGVFALPMRRRAFWLGTGGVCLALLVVPDDVLSTVGAVQRPFAIFALVIAVLAAAGAEMLAARVPSGRWANALLLGVGALLMQRMLPPAGHQLPYAGAREARLETPDVAGLTGGVERLVALGTTMPPDITATLRGADVRAASLEREPRYAAALRPRRDGTIPFTRALDPELPRLGARWTIEPSSLRIVSSELFARTIFATATPTQSRFALQVPGGAVRIGVPTSQGSAAGVVLERRRRRAELRLDPALAAESDAWRWYAVPRKWPAGPATLALASAPPAVQPMAILWDVSGLRLVTEQAGARVWESDRARPLAFLARGIVAESDPPPNDPLVVRVPGYRVGALEAAATTTATGRARVVDVGPQTLVVDVQTTQPRLLVTLLKYRPALWRVTIDGERAATQVVDGLWTAVVVPGRDSRVTVEAVVPSWAWLLGAAGFVAVGLLAATGRSA